MSRSSIPELRKLGVEENSPAQAIAFVPLLHALGGGAGALDEFIAFGLIIAFLLGLAFLARRSASKSKARRRSRRSRSQIETKNRRE